MAGSDNETSVNNLKDSLDTDIIIVHVEVCLFDRCAEDNDLENEVDNYLMEKEEFVLNTLLYDTLLPSKIKYIRICSNDSRHKVNFLTQKTQKHFHFYEPYQTGPEMELLVPGKDDTPALLDWSLPNQIFEGLWESLVLDYNIKEQLMSYIETTILYSIKKVDAQMILWNGIVLLYGLPGTGKTSLCKALAQKLSIRYNSMYSSTQLIEINCHSLFSKWFSESAKQVSKIFSLITNLLETEKYFVCILMDEVESLVHDRESGYRKNEPSDAIRVVNAVLTQIDQLKRYRNFIILATSNLFGVIDTAFADRADLKLRIPNISRWGAYEILKSCIEELISRELIKGNKNDFFGRAIFKSMLPNSTEPNFTVNDIMQNSKALLSVVDCGLNGLNGRTLRRIPFLTSSKFINKETPNIKEFLESMKNIILSYKSQNKDFFKL